MAPFGAVFVGLVSIVSLFLSVEPEQSVCGSVSLENIDPIQNLPSNQTVTLPEKAGEVNYELVRRETAFSEVFSDVMRDFGRSAKKQFCANLDGAEIWECRFEDREDSSFGYILFTGNFEDKGDQGPVRASVYLRPSEGGILTLETPASDDIEGEECNLAKAIYLLNESMAAGTPVPTE